MFKNELDQKKMRSHRLILAKEISCHTVMKITPRETLAFCTKTLSRGITIRKFNHRLEELNTSLTVFIRAPDCIAENHQSIRAKIPT